MSEHQLGEKTFLKFEISDFKSHTQNRKINETNFIGHNTGLQDWFSRESLLIRLPFKTVLGKRRDEHTDDPAKSFDFCESTFE